MVSTKAPPNIKQRFLPISMSQMKKSQIILGSVARTFVIPKWISGKMTVVRIEEDSLEAPLSRVAPPHSPNPLTRLLTLKLKVKVSKETGHVNIAKLGTSAVAKTAKCVI